MKLYAAVTDQEWFDYLISVRDLDEVNFWQPSTIPDFHALDPGDLFLFKLHSEPAHGLSRPDRRRRITATLEPQATVCARCGRPLARIGEEVTEEIDWAPAKLMRWRIVRPKYPCQSLEVGVCAAPLLPRLLPQSTLAQAVRHLWMSTMPCKEVPAVHRQSGCRAAQRRDLFDRGQLRPARHQSAGSPEERSRPPARAWDQSHRGTAARQPAGGLTRLELSGGRRDDLSKGSKINLRAAILARGSYRFQRP